MDPDRSFQEGMYGVNNGQKVCVDNYSSSLQLNSLSEDGCLVSCSVSDAPILLYIKKQMAEGE